jgi:hypothetical protein
MSQARRLPMTFEQFLEWERRQERKNEFVDGVVELPAIGISITMTEIYDGRDDLDPIQDEANE